MKIPLAVVLIGLLGGPLARAADAAVPAVDAPRLAAFMEQWQHYQPFRFPTNETDGPLLLAALARDPAGPWFAYLSMQFASAGHQLRGLPAPARQAAAAKNADTLKSAVQILAAAVRAGGTNAAALASEQAMLQQALGPMLLEAGPKYLPDARALAQGMLAHLPATNDWDYGNLVYAGNQLLGQAALREGRLDEARACLRAAGQAPGSPQLSSFGPDNRLARELLHHGDPADRAAVLAYLAETAHFWAHPLPNNPNAQRVAADHLKKLDEWKAAIQAGNIPDELQWH